MIDNIKAVIFDMDGSLIDSMWVWRNLDRRYLSNKGINVTDELLRDVQKGIQGMSFNETARYFKDRFSLEDSIEQIGIDWNNMAFDMYKHEVALKDGAYEFIKSLVSKGVLLGIATSNSRELVDMYVKEHGLDGYFSVVMTADDVKAGKPAPDIYLAVAEKMGVDTADCLVFEDIVEGIKAGKNAGMKVCAVYDDYSAYQDEEKRRLADYYIKSFKEFLGLIF